MSIPRTPLILLIPLIPLVSSCALERRDLPPEEVLKRATEVAQELESVAFDADIDLMMKGGEGMLTGKSTLRGRMQDGGEQMHFTLAFQGETRKEDGNASIDAVVEVIVAGGSETYLKVHSLTVDPPLLALPPERIEKLAESWLFIPSKIPAGPMLRMTPDPELLRAQVGIVRVSQDWGIDFVGSARAYHYEVALDTEKLLAFLEKVALERNEPFDREGTAQALLSLEASGELWIDTKTFVVRKLQWRVDFGGGSSSLFAVRLFDHGDVEPIRPPALSTLFALPSLPDALPLLPHLRQGFGGRAVGGSGMLSPDL